jgi:enoyl-CoA hydratase/carnithine racemase
VTEVAEEPLAAAMELARELTMKSPASLRAAKRLIALAESGAGAAEVLMAESMEQAGLMGTPEQMEVVAAQFQKRTPNFG